MRPCSIAESKIGQRPLPLMDIKQLCEYINVSESGARKMILEQRIPVVRVGRLIRFRRAAVEAWLDKQTTVERGER